LAVVRGWAGRRRDPGLARPIECPYAEKAWLLAGDRQLGKVCGSDGHRLLAYRA
jgi:hypothetical protein